MKLEKEGKKSPKLDFVFKLSFPATAKNVVVRARSEEKAIEKVSHSRDARGCSKITLIKVGIEGGRKDA